MINKILCLNPATLEVLGEIKIAGENEVREAVLRAREAQIKWGELSVKERVKYLDALKETVIKRMDEISEIISAETGKPPFEALVGEILPVLLTADYYKKHAPSILKTRRIKPSSPVTKINKSYIVYEPVGVVGIISPWNYPFSIPATQTITAVVAGNSVIIKPSEYTTLVGLKIEEIFKEALFPENLVQVIPGNGSTGALLVSSGVNKVVFTGSVPTGQKIMSMASQNLVPIVLELGGKDPMIIFKDADLKKAARACVWGAFTNSGQVCASVERLYVQEDVYDYILPLILEYTNQLKQGWGKEGYWDIGSMTTEAQLRKVEDHIEDAIKKGAKVLCGGKKKEAGGLFFEPTVLINVNHSMKIMKEETFGPVLPVMKFRDPDEAIKLANDSEFGLNAYLWTSDKKFAFEVAKKIKAGTVIINNNLYTYGAPDTPWGGVKKSGMGRTHGKEGLLEMVEAKHINVDRNLFREELWWFPYTRKKLELAKLGMKAYFSPSIMERMKNFLHFLRLVFKKL